ncbi:hypothetical protein [Streptacidiphilus carbonis]|uniref:hypothetical protein n=1 Tax=Streptacidiphilus carbonis TaxID=105422 RepID=UPI0005AADBBC|nr:hypothetical protein [Streptacidiphilus carbonis]
MPKGNNTFTHPTAAPAWAAETFTGNSGDRRQYGWTSHHGDSAKLDAPGPEGGLVVEAQLFQLVEDGEAVQTYLRFMGAEDSSIETDLTAGEADELIAAAEQWLTKIRGFRAQMGRGQ